MRVLLPYLIGSLIAATALGAAFYAGARFTADRQEADYIEGVQDAQDATSDLPQSDDGNLEWLHRWLNGR